MFVSISIYMLLCAFFLHYKVCCLGFLPLNTICIRPVDLNDDLPKCKGFNKRPKAFQRSSHTRPVSLVWGEKHIK